MTVKEKATLVATLTFIGDLANEMIRLAALDHTHLAAQPATALRSYMEEVSAIVTREVTSHGPDAQTETGAGDIQGLQP